MDNQMKTNPDKCHPEVFLRKGVLKICNKFTGEQQCRSVTIEIMDVRVLHIFRAPFPKNIFEWLLLDTLNVIVEKQIIVNSKFEKLLRLKFNYSLVVNTYIYDIWRKFRLTCLIKNSTVHGL